MAAVLFFLRLPEPVFYEDIFKSKLKVIKKEDPIYLFRFRNARETVRLCIRRTNSRIRRWTIRW